MTVAVVVLVLDGNGSLGSGCVVGCKGTGNCGGGGYCLGGCYGAGKCCGHHTVMVAAQMTVAGRCVIFLDSTSYLKKYRLYK